MIPGRRINANDLVFRGDERDTSIRYTAYDLPHGGRIFILLRVRDSRIVAQCACDSCSARFFRMTEEGDMRRIVRDSVRACCETIAGMGIPAWSGYLDDGSQEIVFEDEFLPQEAAR